MPNQQRLMFYTSRAIELCKAQKDSLGLAFSYTVAAEYFFETGQLDSSLFYAQQSYAVLTGYKDKQHISELQQSSTLALMGAVYLKKGNNEEAVRLLRHSIDIGLKYQLQTNHWLAYATLSEYFLKTGAVDSSLYYAIEAHETAQKTALPEELQKTSALLAALYKKTGAKDSALKYYELAAALSNSVNNAIKKQKLQSQDFEEQVQQQELQERKAKEKVHLLIVGLGLSLLIALFLFWNNRQRKKTNTVLHQKNLQIEHTLNELKATQAQLVQREKMASLGELTAGIAHEIQNPLNFVNNFSEVNTELITELKQELAQGNMDESKSLASDIEENEQKINLHGKRADAIVKGMLQHSRKNIGEKQPTDINVLTDEYLRLSFHGMRAKDKSFNATMQTSFDESIGKANIVPQDIGRVLLNLFNNAFYAVNEKKKQQSEDYEPTVLVNTKKLADKIEVRVQDNGMGISKSLVDKIFQPFFTTKPTGQGTGLGLSLSYDIIKAHGGNISVVSEEGVGTTFVVQMPVA
jgi:signal transduction histidine kinase